MAKTKKILACLLTFVMVIGLCSNLTFAKADDNFLDAGNLTAGDVKTSISYGDFTIKATEEKGITIDASEKTADDGTVFTQRIKMNGSGKASYRSIHFSTAGAATLVIYAMSASSSADRVTGLYSADGTLKAEVPAYGASIVTAKIDIEEAGDYYIASPDSGINIYGIRLEAAGVEMIFNASELSASEYGENFISGDFTIKATGEKKVTIDASEKTADDGTTFTQRLKLSGSGKESYRSLHFSVGGAATVKVYAMSASSSADRALALYASDGTEIGSVPAYGASIVSGVLEITEAGDYYLASPDSGVNIYGVIVSTGSKKEVIRADWSEVEAPVITEAKQTEDTNKIAVSVKMVTGDDGADSVVVTMYDSEDNKVKEITLMKSADETQIAEFSVSKSGTYKFTAVASREGEEAAKTSESVTAEFKLLLAAPVPRAINQGNASLRIKWSEVKEAEAYKVMYKEAGAESFAETVETTATSVLLDELTVDKEYVIAVAAIRADETKQSEEITKVAKEDSERDWIFTYFGQSVSSSRNYMEMIDEENLSFKLYSCTVKDDGSINSKGGKFTNFHDGISYYYTEIDPATENFELTATFTVDYINPTPDGQEGFGIVAMDSLGEYGVSSVNHYTNSASLIAWKYEGRVDGVKYSCKDTLGYRFVSGLNNEVLSGGDAAVSENGLVSSGAYNYMPENLVKTGESYTLTLKKTNTGYHAIYDGQEYIMYGVDKLLQIENDKIYVGFAVARGCNVTVDNVIFTTSDPATDAPAEAEPAEEVDLTVTATSPMTASLKNYNLIVKTNADGTLQVKDGAGNVLLENGTVTANQKYYFETTLVKGINDFEINFTPAADYVPGENKILSSYETKTITYSVNYKEYSGDVLYVSQEGTPDGDGTKENPLDLVTATEYLKPGQTIELAGGTYMLTSQVKIVKENDGTEYNYKKITSADGERAVLDFTNANGGFVLWGDYWYISNIDICNTPGDTKGMQIAGHYNVIEGVNAYNNGDTGIQISGSASDPKEEWPTNNLIVNCTSHDNCDPGMNNADGFAAKITSGEGNVFRGCIAYNNLDDGWDLYAKIESGPIGAVVIEQCVAYANGTLSDGTGNGDGNGFKLGGDGIAVEHKLIDSIAYNNNTNGITSNSNPSAQVINCTSYGNKGSNVTLYGKGTDPRNFVVENLVSLKGGSSDNISEQPELADETNYFWTSGKAVNSLGNELTEEIFESTDMSVAPSRDENGLIDMHGLLILNSSQEYIAGAKFEQQPYEFSESSVIEYVVKPGDYLRKIAAELLGDEMKWKNIYDSNTDVIVNPDLIFIGQVLKVYRMTE